jgi:AcrR family transcriptional regulator
MSSPTAARRSVGRPRQHEDDVERRLIFDAAYAALRDHGHDFTIANILEAAGISTRSFYRHFESKDTLLCAMYLRDGEWAAARLAKRLADAATPRQAVEWWIDEIFSFTRSPRRAERVSVLGSIIGTRAEGADVVAFQSRRALIEPLQAAIEAGCGDGTFAVDDPEGVADLIAAACLHAAGLAVPHRGARDQATTTAFCLRAIGAATER